MNDSFGDSITNYVDTDEQAEVCDRTTGRDYLPMNVFVDPKTIEARFQHSSFNAD